MLRLPCCLDGRRHETAKSVAGLRDGVELLQLEIPGRHRWALTNRRKRHSNGHSAKSGDGLLPQVELKEIIEMSIEPH